MPSYQIQEMQQCKKNISTKARKDAFFLRLSIDKEYRQVKL